MTIDRIENNIAIIENDDGTIVQIPLTLLPSNAKEGDILILEDDKYVIDYLQTEKSQLNMIKLLNFLTKKD